MEERRTTETGPRAIRFIGLDREVDPRDAKVRQLNAALDALIAELERDAQAA